MLEINKVYNMDCVEGMRLLDDCSVDLTVTSPPYDNLREYKGFDFDFEGTAKELYRVTKEGGIVVWVVGDAMVNGSETGTSFKQALFFKECGFRLHDTMIWRKPNPFNFGSNDCYIQAFEYMFVLCKGKVKTTNFIYDRENKSGGTLIVSQSRKGDWMQYDYQNSKYITKEYGKRHNVQDIPTSSGKGLHPAVFPEKLAQDHILSWSNEGDLVLDTFLGSGTTAIMAKENNRNYIGFEISKEYCDIAEKRLSYSNFQFQIEVQKGGQNGRTTNKRRY